MWQTRLTEKVSIQFPIIQAPMSGATTPELVAAVSNAGGLGSLGAGYMAPAEIRCAIRKIRELTVKPFAVNLFISNECHATPDQIHDACHDINECCFELDIKIEPISPPYTPSFEEQINILIEEKIPVFSHTFGVLDSYWVTQFKKTNTVLMGTATNLSEAYVLEKTGMDMIVVQGSEAGGHRGSFLGKAENSLTPLTTLMLQIRNQLKIPVVAAGGIMNGNGISHMINLGAAGVQMGTAFLSCSEAGIHPLYKQALLNQRQDNTILTRAFSGKMARGLRNKFTDCMQNKTRNILDYPIQNALTSMLRLKAKEKNQIDFMSMWAGQSASLCRSMTSNELVHTLVSEAEEL